MTHLPCLPSQGQGHLLPNFRTYADVYRDKEARQKALKEQLQVCITAISFVSLTAPDPALQPTDLLMICDSRSKGEASSPTRALRWSNASSSQTFPSCSTPRCAPQNPFLSRVHTSFIACGWSRLALQVRSKSASIDELASSIGSMNEQKKPSVHKQQGFSSSEFLDSGGAKVMRLG
jgi:hypothetical protein